MNLRIYFVKIFTILISVILSNKSNSQIIDLSIMGKSPIETKNYLGSRNFSLTFEKNEIQKFEKEYYYNLGDPIKILVTVHFCNNNLDQIITDFVFLPHEIERSRNYFNFIKEEIENVINPKPKKRKERNLWTPLPVDIEYNILGKDLLYKEKILWKNINGIDILLGDIKQVKDYSPYKSGVGMLINRLILLKNEMKEDCYEVPEYLNFFNKYFIDGIEPNNLNYYLYTYIDDLNSFGVFDHLNINNENFEKILMTFTNNFNIYFQDITKPNNKPDYNTIAIAHSMFDNCKLDIQVDPSKWNESTNVKRLWILYHELSHDLFNVEHGQGGPLMDPTLPPNLTEEYFSTSRITLINYLKNIKFDKTCNQKGKSKLEELLNKKN